MGPLLLVLVSPFSLFVASRFRTFVLPPFFSCILLQGCREPLSAPSTTPFFYLSYLMDIVGSPCSLRTTHLVFCDVTLQDSAVRRLCMYLVPLSSLCSSPHSHMPVLGPFSLFVILCFILTILFISIRYPCSTGYSRQHRAPRGSSSASCTTR
jgi:hypothetical protein